MRKIGSGAVHVDQRRGLTVHRGRPHLSEQPDKLRTRTRMFAGRQHQPDDPPLLPHLHTTTSTSQSSTPRAPLHRSTPARRCSPASRARRDPPRAYRTQHGEVHVSAFEPTRVLRRSIFVGGHRRPTDCHLVCARRARWRPRATIRRARVSCTSTSTLPHASRTAWLCRRLGVDGAGLCGDG